MNKEKEEKNIHPKYIGTWTKRDSKADDLLLITKDFLLLKDRVNKDKPLSNDNYYSVAASLEIISHKKFKIKTLKVYNRDNIEVDSSSIGVCRYKNNQLELKLRGKREFYVPLFRSRVF